METCFGHFFLSVLCPIPRPRHSYPPPPPPSVGHRVAAFGVFCFSVQYLTDLASDLLTTPSHTGMGGGGMGFCLEETMLGISDIGQVFVEIES